jgi:hypothetical protein
LSATSRAFFSSRASSAGRIESAREAQDQDAELLTRLIYQQVLTTRQKQRVQFSSSQADLDQVFRRMGIA